MSDPKTPPIPVKIATYHYGEDKDHAVSQDVAISMEVIDDRLSLFVDSTSYKGDITGRLTLNREAAHTLGRALIDFAHPTPPERIHLFDVDPDTLVGISACDDGEPGWVVLQLREPDRDDMTVIAPLSDAHGELVWFDINDAVEVYQTGKVWKHDMGEGEPDEPETPPTITTKE